MTDKEKLPAKQFLGHAKVCTSDWCRYVNAATGEACQTYRNRIECEEQVAFAGPLIDAIEAELKKLGHKKIEREDGKYTSNLGGISHIDATPIGLRITAYMADTTSYRRRWKRGVYRICYSPGYQLGRDVNKRLPKKPDPVKIAAEVSEVVKRRAAYDEANQRALKLQRASETAAKKLSDELAKISPVVTRLLRGSRVADRVAAEGMVKLFPNGLRVTTVEARIILVAIEEALG